MVCRFGPLPQIDIAEQCEALSSLETRLNQPLGLDEYNHFIGYLLFNPSRDVVVSVTYHSYSRSVKLSEIKTVSMDVTPRNFKN